MRRHARLAGLVAGLAGLVVAFVAGPAGAAAAGTPHAWGSNEGGQLGDGTLTNRPVAVRVSGIGAAAQLAGGWGHSYGLVAPAP